MMPAADGTWDFSVRESLTRIFSEKVPALAFCKALQRQPAAKALIASLHRGSTLL